MQTHTLAPGNAPGDRAGRPSAARAGVGARAFFRCRRATRHPCLL